MRGVRPNSPIQTMVVESEDHVIREALIREIERKGQAFFIHNRVKGIENVAKKLSNLVPQARIAVSHGQL